VRVGDDGGKPANGTPADFAALEAEPGPAGFAGCVVHYELSTRHPLKNSNDRASPTARKPTPPTVARHEDGR
jgi:hypothetical protein